MKNLWGKTEVEELRRLFKTKKTTAEIAAILGRSREAVSVKAHRLGIAKNPSYRKDLTDRQQLWLKLNYPHMATKICALMLDISPRTCVRWARRLGVEKTAQFMKETQAFTARKAKESHLAHGTYPPKGIINENIAKGEAYRFKPGHKSTRKKKEPCNSKQE